MNFRMLEVFWAVMQTGSVTEASASLGRSQPAISRGLAELERAVGYRLFDRVNRRLVPTEEAVQLFEEVERAFTGLDRIREAARDIGGRRLNQVRVAAMPAIGFSLLPAVAERVETAAPGLAMTIEIRSSAWVIQSVLNRQSDVGIAGLPLDHPGLQLAFVVAAPCVCVLPSGHRLAAAERVEPADLAGERFVSLGSNYRTRQRTDRIFDDLGIHRQMRVESQLSEMVCLLVSRGLGAAVVDPFTPHLRSDLDVIVKAFSPEVPFEWGVFTQAGRHIAPPVTTFLQTIKTLAQDSPVPDVHVKQPTGPREQANA